MSELHLRVFKNKSELVGNDGNKEVFLEGKCSKNAKVRYQKISRELSKDYLERQIIFCRDRAGSLELSQLQSIQIDMLNKLVNSVTSEVGRALVGLAMISVANATRGAMLPTQNPTIYLLTVTVTSSD